MFRFERFFLLIGEIGDAFAIKLTVPVSDLKEEFFDLLFVELTCLLEVLDVTIGGISQHGVVDRQDVLPQLLVQGLELRFFTKLRQRVL